MYKLILILIITLVLFARAAKDRSCMSLEYNEKMLEKMIRMEMAFAEATENVNKVSNETKHNISELQVERESMNEQIAAMKTELGVIKDELRETTRKLKELRKMDVEIEAMKDERKKEIENFREMVNLFTKQHSVFTGMSALMAEMNNGTIENIKGQSQKSDVAFKATLSDTIQASSGTTVIFPAVILNRGDGYNATSGRFTAPCSGTYIVTVQVSPYNGNIVEVNIVVDGKDYTKSYFYEQNDTIGFSTTDVMYLQNGAQVWIVLGPSTTSSARILHENYDTTFFAMALV